MLKMKREKSKYGKGKIIRYTLSLRLESGFIHQIIFGFEITFYGVWISDSHWPKVFGRISEILKILMSRNHENPKEQSMTNFRIWIGRNSHFTLLPSKIGSYPLNDSHFIIMFTRLSFHAKNVHELSWIKSAAQWRRKWKKFLKILMSHQVRALLSEWWVILDIFKN